MSDMSISNEDREKLVDLRFRELLDKAADDPIFFQKFADRVIEYAQLKQQPRQGQQQQGQERHPSNGNVEEQKPQRKKNMLEIALGM